MKTCAGCRFFVGALEGQCHAEPPRKSSERGGSYRPTVSHADPVCQHFRPPMPAAANIKRDEVTMTIKVEVDPELKRIFDSLPKAEQNRLVSTGAVKEARRGPRIFCLAAQSASVRAFMREAGWDAKVITIASPEAAKGFCGGIFISVVGHPQAIPEALFDVIKEHGFIVWTVSDKFIRDKADRLTGKF